MRAWSLAHRRTPRQGAVGSLSPSLGKNGSRAHNDLLVAKDGLVGVTYEKRIQGAPGSCRYMRPQRAKTGLALTAGQQWTCEPIGEGAPAHCTVIGE
ncbi:MAG: hypothetical protein IV100_08600 [Myxococcales bacterium]|nr:hypothetical protein [Myxococcales bacterium]